MRTFSKTGLVIAILAIIALGLRGGVFAQDATPISDATPIVETPDVLDEATPAAVQAEFLTIVVVERATTDTVIDLGDEGDSIGDLLVFANQIYDESNEELIGSDQGSCVRTVPGTSYECAWTLTLDDGQIMVQGPFVDGENSVLAITGGTGAYVGATGEMTTRTLSDSEIEFTYEIR